MTIDEAMIDLLNTNCWYKMLNIHVSRQYANSFKQRFKDGQMKHETKLSTLLKCGYKIGTPLTITK